MKTKCLAVAALLLAAAAPTFRNPAGADHRGFWKSAS
jgi:hypothetical protein